MLWRSIAVRGLIIVVFVALLFSSSCASFPTSSLSTKVVSTVQTEPGELTLHYFERFPYMYQPEAEDEVSGLTASRAARLFQAADIPFHWQDTPPKRQLYLLEKDEGRDCLLGWFKNSEREELGAFTLPIYQDQPYVALTRADNDRLVSGRVISQTLSSRDLILLEREGFSYGQFLDTQLAEYEPNYITTTVGLVDMLRMVVAGRADYFFIAPEEAQGLFELGPFSSEDFKLVNFTDMPSGEKRYIWCSFSVEDSILDRLDNAIRQELAAPLWE